MGIILWVLILIGALTLFFKGNLGLFGLLFLAVIIWNFIGAILDNRKNR